MENKQELGILSTQGNTEQKPFKGREILSANNQGRYENFKKRN